MPLAYLPLFIPYSSPRHHDGSRPQTGGQLALTTAVPVATARCTHPLRLPRAQRRLQLLFHDCFDHPADPPADLALDQVSSPLQPFFPYCLPAIPYHWRHHPLLACQASASFASLNSLDDDAFFLFPPTTRHYLFSRLV